MQKLQRKSYKRINKSYNNHIQSYKTCKTGSNNNTNSYLKHRLYTKILIHEQKIFLASNCGLVSQIDYSNDYLMFYLSE